MDTYKDGILLQMRVLLQKNEITTNKNNQKIGPSGDILQWLEEPSYFFKLSKWQNKLLNFARKPRLHKAKIKI